MDEDPFSDQVTHSSFNLQSYDGLSLFGQSWLPQDVPVANIILIHNLGGHSGRYHHVAGYFCERNYAVYAIDLRGHGQSDGLRGHIEHFQDYLNDVRALVAHVVDKGQLAPFFLLGHSVGGLIALMYALEHPEDISSVIASSPALCLQARVSGWRLFLTNLISMVNPSLTMYNQLEPESLSQNETMVAAYKADPLVHNQLTARWVTEYEEAAEWTMENANALAVPALILQGGSDQIVDPAGTRAFFDQVGLEDKYYIEYETFYHDIFNEPEALSVLGDIEAWLLPRLQPQVGIFPIAS